MEKTGRKNDKADGTEVKEDEYVIERDVVLESKIKLGRDKSSMW